MFCSRWQSFLLLLSALFQEQTESRKVGTLLKVRLSPDLLTQAQG